MHLPTHPSRYTLVVVAALLTAAESARAQRPPWWATSPPASAPSVDLVVEVTPDRPAFSLYEQITGKVTFRNVSGREIVVPRWKLNRVNAFELSGRPAQEFSMRGSVTMAPDWHTKKLHLAPGQSESVAFIVATDPRASWFNGFVLPEGRWRLRLRPLDEKSVSVRGRDAEVAVRVEPGTFTGPRILHLTPREHRVVLRREGGRLDVIDIDKQALLGARVLTDFDPEWIWYGARGDISPDGRLLAYCPTRDPEIRIAALWGDAPKRAVLAAPPDLPIGAGGFYAKRFAPDGAVLFAATNDWIVGLDIASGVLTQRSQSPTMWSDVSPDGRFLVGIENNGVLVGRRGDDRFRVEITPARPGADPRKVELRGYGERVDLTAGVGGLYVTGEFVPGVLHIAYETGAFRLFEGESCQVDSESPDGRLLAVSTADPMADPLPSKPTRVSVWSVADARRVFDLPSAGCRRGAFITGPLRLIGVEWTTTGDSAWIRERITLHSAATGERIGELDLAPLLST